ncbi:hypothetical protein [Ponticaulis sp.]|uniref:hypothetical protein n=1 Tax=Ponticaulis sp. TaxID=2020902 RepID=UPI0025D1919A|nr:hypothetical protein [Ponticaulis sp.]|tara:strand:- start:5355 stop:5807 length:453 start_codon:yes stop_codon:yes gene_type:complete
MMPLTLKGLHFMLRTVQLILPALIPSWNFFDVIAPSPRIEYALLSASDEPPTDWQPFRPRPEKISVLTMVRRLFWNRHWNESLFLVSCAERLSQGITPEHSAGEIFARMKRDLSGAAGATHFCFRLVFIHREGETLTHEIICVSEAEPLT